MKWVKSMPRKSLGNIYKFYSYPYNASEHTNFYILIIRNKKKSEKMCEMYMLQNVCLMEITRYYHMIHTAKIRSP